MQNKLFARENGKRCPECGETKPLEDFPRNRGARDGRATYCKPCHNARGKESRQRLYGSSRHYHFTRRYGISAAQADELLAAQGGVCPVCETRPPEHVDHDHEAGWVRGILCLPCNTGLGSFRDKIEWLEKAITYLEEGAEQKRGMQGHKPPDTAREAAALYVVA